MIKVRVMTMSKDYGIRLFGRVPCKGEGVVVDGDLLEVMSVIHTSEKTECPASIMAEEIA